jgi:NitT/TauT family transport system substrate-binding protein
MPAFLRPLRTDAWRRARRGVCAAARVLAALAVAVPGVAARAAAGPLEAVSVATARSPMSLPLYVAQERGYFAAAGLDVRLDDCLGGHRCLQRLDEGRADLATCSELPVVFDAFGSTGATVIATMVTTSDDLKFVVRKELAGLAPAQLASRRIGLVPGSASQYYLDMLLMNLGVDPRGARLVELAPEAMLPAMRAGEVDALAVWEPVAWQALHAADLGAVRSAAAAGYIESFNLVAGPRSAGPRDATLARLLGALDRAEQFIRDEPGPAQAILRARLGLDQAFVDWVWPGLAWRLTLDQALLTTMESELRWAHREGRVASQGRPDVLALVHAAPLRAVKPGAVGTGG